MIGLLSDAVMIVDGTNLFIRSYVVVPTLDVNGEHIGGVDGFLKSLRLLVDINKPKRVIVVWEGGGSTRRRSLFPEYKQHRRPPKLNRFYGQDEMADTDENRVKQIVALVKILKMLPVCQVYVQDLEGDDVIAHIVRTRFDGSNKLIVSSDKDMYQLLDETTVAYLPTRKIYMTKDDVREKYSISAANFALAKAICGDPSDNIPGIKGVGFKTLAKRVPELDGDARLSIDDLIALCKDREKVKACASIVEDRELIKRNLKLVDLDMDIMISATQALKIDDALDMCEPKLDKMGFIKSLIQHGIASLDADYLCMTLSYLAAK